MTETFKPPRNNPFTTAGVIEDPRRFFGRERELAFIWNKLRNSADVSIVGERRTGKTSLLWYIKEMAVRELGRNAPSVHYLDFQLIPEAGDFFSRLAEVLQAKGETPYDLERALANRSVILCLDEFDRTARNPAFPHDFFAALRGLAQGSHLTLVIATKVPLIEFSTTGGMTSPFFNIFTTITLGPLTDDEARELLVKTAALAEIKFNEATLTNALKLAEGYPWRLQLIGWHLVDSGLNFNVAEKRFREALEESGGQTKKAFSQTPHVLARYEWVMPLALALTGVAFLLGLFSALAQSAGLALAALTLLVTALGIFLFQAFLIWRR